MQGVNDLLGIPEKSAPNEIWLAGGNGYGSTLTNNRRFTTIVRNTTQDVLYTDSITDGAVLTVRTPGVYFLYYQDFRAGSTGIVGFTKNDISGVAVTSQSPPVNLGYANMGSNLTGSICVPAYLFAGDIVRVNAAASGTGVADVQFRMIKVGIGG